jgi:hypothetical protein
MPPALSSHSTDSCGPSSFHDGQPLCPASRGAHNGRGGRHHTIDPVVIGRVVHEASGFDKRLSTGQ